MENESLDITTLDIDKLRAIIFPSVAQSTHHSLAISNAQTDTRQIQHAIVYQTRDAGTHPDNESGLASVVQDSQEIANVDGSSWEQLKPISPDVFRRLHAMNSQSGLAEGTQLISQSFYESILRKERSTKYETQDEESQRTYEEGDSGHVDITSSFIAHNEQGEDLADSEPIDFSPVQSQQQLTQYPESQRFKTPATAGKKRRYNGDVVDTPAPIRNPLAKDGQTTPGGALGLSQAFAATQAPSSPLSNELPTNPRSDRPSPNIELQTRPALGVSSSPSLRPIGDLRRAVTEPASRYKPVKQSQAERERQERLEILPDDVDPGTFDEDFDRLDSVTARQRRQRERKRETKQELRSLSSPILHVQDYPTSSPTKPQLEVPKGARSTQSLPPDSPINLDALEDNTSIVAAASEEDTEQEENPRIDVRRSSQVRRVHEEDKENDAILVPKTVLRRRFEVEHETTQVDASPSARYAAKDSGVLTEDGLNSSDPFRIMDSQSSQTRTRLRSSARNAPQPFTAAQIDPSSEQNLSHPESEVLSEQLIESDPTSHPRNTIPETASEDHAGVIDRDAPTFGTETTNTENTAKPGTDFETAPTHFSAPSASQSLQASSPIRTTPPGRKRRRRMMEISADTTPRKPQSELSFNAEAILQLDEDQAASTLLQASPFRARNASRKLATVTNVPTFRTRGTHGTASSQTAAGSPLASQIDGQTSQQVAFNSSAESRPEHRTDMSQEIVRPGRQAHRPRLPTVMEKNMPSRSEILSTSRHSIFDLSASPEECAALNTLREEPVNDKHFLKPKKGKNGARGVSRMEQRLKSEATPKSSKKASNEVTNGDSNVAQHSEIGALTIDSTTNGLSDAIVAPHMVLAYFRGDPRGYYPAEVLARTTDNGYRIQWQGYEPEEVDQYGVKALDLRVGDSIKILAKGFTKVPYIIQGFKNKLTPPDERVTDIRGYQTLIVSQKQRKSLPADIKEVSRQEVPVSVIYLDVNMWAQMKSRDQEFTPAETSLTTTSSSARTTPLRGGSTPATPSSRSRRQTFVSTDTGLLKVDGIFAGMAFVISYDDPVQKDLLTTLVQSNGGQIIHESFHDLFASDTVELKTQYQRVGFTALLTERHSRKEKYMQALALGLPCISGKWVESSVKHACLQHWQSYLLPAGESIELDNATRSRTLPDFNIREAKLTTMLQLKPNSLNDCPVIAVVGRSKAEHKRAPYLFLMQAIGASQIHKVPDMKSAKQFSESDEGKAYKWIFVDDKDVESMRSILHTTEAGKKVGIKSKKGKIENQLQCRVAGNELIVQSVILGRLYDP